MVVELYVQEAHLHVGEISWYTSVDNITFALSEYTTPDAFFLPVDIQETMYVKAVVSADGCTSVESNVETITVTTAPVVGSITGQGAVCAPTNSLTLTVEDYTGSIQWQSSSDEETYTDISGATGATYTATNTAATTYYRVVTTIGSCTATSYSALVEVTPTAVAGTVSGAATVCTGSNNTELTLSGYTGNIQWQSSSNNSTFTDISSQTETVYFATDLTATTYYRVKVSNSCGTVYTSSVTMTVSAPSVGGSVSGSATVCYGTNSTTLTLSGHTGTIQWQSSADNTSFIDISSQTSTTYSAMNLTATTYYRAVVTNGACVAANSTTATVTVRSQTTAGSIGSDETICSGGDPVAFTSGVAGSGDGVISYRWESAVSPFSSWSTISGATAATYDAPSGLTATTQYRRTTVATLSSLACSSDPTSVVTVTVNEIPTITSTTDGTRNGAGTVTLSAVASAGTVSWYAASTGGTALSTGTSYTTPSLSSTTIYYVDATDNGCTTGSRTAVTATVIPTPLITGVTDGSVCGYGAVTLSATATFGTIHWYTDVSGGSSIATGTSYTTGALSATTVYYVDAVEGSDVSPTRTAVTATVNPNTWIGASSGLFSTSIANWSCGRAPQLTDNVLISDAQLTFGADYSILGSWTLSGTSTLTVNPGYTLSIPSGSTVDLGGKEVVFKSDATGTGQLGVVAGTLTGATNVVVERHIPAGKRAFRFFSSAVTTTGSIRDNWMEGATPAVGSLYPFRTQSEYNPNPGYGTLITGSGGAANGFDASETNNASLFRFDNSTGAWAEVTSTAGTISAGAAYRMLVRGDRSYNLMASVQPTPTATILRTRGAIVTGTLTSGVGLPALSQTIGGWSLVGNPYQSVVDMSGSDVVKTNLTDYYYVWDPRMGTRGAYVAYNYVTNVSANVSSAVNRYVQPGQAFFVQSSGVGSSIQFTEAGKGSASNQTATFGKNDGKGGGTGNEGDKLEVTQQRNEVTQSGGFASLSMLLYETDSLTKGGTPADATRVLFGAGYNNNVDVKDGRKFTNLDETMAIKRSTTLLSMELRSMPDTGTVLPLSITQYRGKQYTLRVMWDRMLTDSTLRGYLKDKFTGKEYMIDRGGSNVDVAYTITSDARSSAADRFEVVFRSASNVVTAVTNWSNGDYVKLYPNPVINLLQVEYKVGIARELTLKVYDMSGREVLERKQLKSGDQVNMNGLLRGVYQYQLLDKTGKFITAGKLLKD